MDIRINIGNESGFHLDNKKTTFTISHKDLAAWFNNFPGNYNLVKVPRGKEKEFATCIFKMLQADAPYEANEYVWSQPFTYVFNEILKDYKPEFLNYFDGNDDEEEY